jgi:hypothetical protein
MRGFAAEDGICADFDGSQLLDALEALVPEK